MLPIGEQKCPQRVGTKELIVWLERVLTSAAPQKFADGAEGARLALSKLLLATKMLRSGNQIRFTPKEIEEGLDHGVDLSQVTTQAGYSEEVIRLITTLEHDRPDLLETIAKALAQKTGVKLPPKLTSV
jgi:hypothetical protein